MKKILLVLITIVFLSSCVALQPQPSVCEKPEAEGSVICSLTQRMSTTPEQVDFLLQVSSALLLEENPSEAGKVLASVNKVMEYSGGSGTYDGLAKLILKERPLVGVVVKKFVDNMVGLEDPIGSLLPISDFDKGMIMYHLQQQKTLIEIAIGE